MKLVSYHVKKPYKFILLSVFANVKNVVVIIGLSAPQKRAFFSAKKRALFVRKQYLFSEKRALFLGNEDFLLFFMHYVCVQKSLQTPYLFTMFFFVFTK